MSLRVRFIAAPPDAHIADQLGSALIAAGVTIVGDDEGADVGVVIVSPSSLADANWRTRVEAAVTLRLAPLRVDQASPADMPGRLNTLQWVDYDPAGPSAVFGRVIAALGRDPERHQQLRQLEVTSTAWLQAGRRSSLLIDDLDRSIETLAVVERSVTAGDLAPGSVQEHFARASVQHSRARRRRRRLTYLAPVAALALFGVMAYIFIPAIRERGRTNVATFVVQPHSSVSRGNPSWIAMLAAASLLEEQGDIADLARTALVETIHEPWEIAPLRSPSDDIAVDGAKPFDDGRWAALVVRDDEGAAFVMTTTASQRFEWAIPLGTAYWWIEFDPDERRAVLAGERGVAVVDMVERTVTEFDLGQEVNRAAFVGDDIVAASWTGDIGLVEAPTMTYRQLANHGSMIDFQSTNDGSVRALMADGDEYRLVDGASGDVIASAIIDDVVIRAGVALPDEVAAIVIGEGRQMWRLDADSSLTPTGIPVPDLTTGWEAFGHGLIAAGGQVRPVDVYDLDTGAAIGRVCEMSQTVGVIVASNNGRVMACNAPFATHFWATPPGSQAPPSEWDARPADIDTELDGNTFRLVRSDGLATEWIDAVSNDIAAISVSAEADRVIIGSVTGEIAMIVLHQTGPLRTTIWQIPNGSPARDVGWSNGEAIAVAADGRAWQVADCLGCDTDRGLVEQLIPRLPRCWTVDQLQWVESSTRRLLGVEPCAESPMEIEL